jgi:hypothetical protein
MCRTAETTVLLLRARGPRTTGPLFGTTGSNRPVAIIGGQELIAKNLSLNARAILARACWLVLTIRLYPCRPTLISPSLPSDREASGLLSPIIRRRRYTS